MRRNCHTCRHVADDFEGCAVLNDDRPESDAVRLWINEQDWSGDGPTDGAGFAWPIRTADGCPGWGKVKGK